MPLLCSLVPRLLFWKRDYYFGGLTEGGIGLWGVLWWRYCGYLKPVLELVLVSEGKAAPNTLKEKSPQNSTQRHASAPSACCVFEGPHIIGIIACATGTPSHKLQESKERSIPALHWLPRLVLNDYGILQTRVLPRRHTPIVTVTLASECSGPVYPAGHETTAVL